ncbi:MAG: DUF2922 domain-containing protein [Clostridia bacterium]|nr:DUF2922 domain-containing protein [Clostridia bacterium]
MITKRLELIFMSSQGRRVTVAVPDPKENLTPAEIQTAMTVIIGENVFESPGGDLVAALGARIVTREVSDYELVV